MNDIYLSTGAFISSRSTRGHLLAIDYYDKLKCDGLELMIFRNWYDRIDDITNDLIDAQVPIKSIHADKRIGNWFSSNIDTDVKTCFEILKINFDMASKIGVKKVVTHIWGIPFSDTYSDIVYDRVGELLELAKSYNVDILIENSPSVNKSPLKHLQKLITLYPSISFTIDTRLAQFCGELEDICQSGIFDNHVSHVHISDYHGENMQFDSLYPILQPLCGDVDFNMFFAYLKEINYSGSFTLEAPSKMSDDVDHISLNKGLDFIRKFQL